MVEASNNRFTTIRYTAMNCGTSAVRVVGKFMCQPYMYIGLFYASVYFFTKMLKCSISCGISFPHHHEVFVVLFYLGYTPFEIDFTTSDNYVMDIHLISYFIDNLQSFIFCILLKGNVWVPMSSHSNA